MSRIAAMSALRVVAAVVCLAGGPVLDVASVKISPADAPHPYTISGGPGSRDTGRFRGAHTTMQYLLQRAYGVPADQVAGPSWIKENPPSVNYEVSVTMPPETTKEQFEKMLQSLLAARFHLMVHHEVRHFPGYELLVDKGGTKLKNVTIEDSLDERPPGPQPRSPDGYIMMTGPATITMNIGDEHHRVKFQQRNMSYFADQLGREIAFDQDLRVSGGDLMPRVVDTTSLNGNYTFTLEYSCPVCAARFGHGASEGDPGSGLPGLFKALQQQLGLRLDKKADISLDVVVVDSVDKMPTAN